MNIVIIGASSGIGRELAMQYGSDSANTLGLVGRREELLRTLSLQVRGPCHIAAFDVTAPDRISRLDQLFDTLKKVDLVIFCAGCGELNPGLDWEITRKTLELNVVAFTEIADWIFLYFARTGGQFARFHGGRFAAIASVAGLRGFDNDSAYSASKAYMIRYLEGLNKKARNEKLPIGITTILPGYIDTDMAKGENMFWICSPELAARKIIAGLQKQRRILYVPRRWFWIGLLLKCLPGCLFERY